MARVSLVDTITVGDAVRRTGDGYLVADARVARTGIQVYAASELGLVDHPTGQVRVYRPPEEVFRDEAMHSYAHRPVTLGHPVGNRVDAKNWKRLAIGQTGGEVVRDGEFVRVPLVLMDQAAIRAYDSGVKELSMGYSSVITFTDGTTPEGEEYDAVMSDMTMNHLAVVAQARGGSDLSLGDNGEEPMTDPVKTQTVVVDGLSIQTTEQGAQVIEKLQKQVADAATAQKKLADDHSSELAKRDAEIEKLQKSQVSDADIEKRVEERAQLVEDARTVAPKVDFAGKTSAEIRRAAVAARVSDAKVLEGRDDVYIQARFDTYLEDAERNPDRVRSAASSGIVRDTGDADRGETDRAYAESLTEIGDAWKQKPTRKEA